MPQVDPSRAESIFTAALEHPAGVERGAYLAGACGDDPALRARVEELLAAHEKSGSFMDTAARPELASPTSSTTAMPSEKPGTVIGRYKLLQEIGEGGFGVVYMAEQTEPVVRKVALKIIKLGMDTRQVIARFEAERQALAMMDHPNIARVLDAGATPEGRPYFVMELVRGDPITEYCDRHNLTVPQRLELFSAVCNAVQHAHQKGIIHRDIKPSNVLVTIADGKAVPKVIDFGIAKATSARLTEKTLFTEFRHLIGTPAYMSPEQAESSGVDIDTRSDIYSLGVLLYELLTGTTPFDPKRLHSAAYGEIQRIIREEEPPRPSTRLSQSTGTLANIAAHRHIEPAKLSRTLRGELDWIVMKCLEKDRTRRYETANGLAMDIQRHLDNEPVLAGPPSATYKLRKFIGRNQGKVAAAAVVAVALLAGIIATSWQAIRATRAEKLAEARLDDVERERETTAAINDFLNDDLLSAVSPVSDEWRGRDARLIDLLETAAKQLERAARPGGRFHDKPLVEAGVRATLGETLRDLGEYEAAKPHTVRAHEIRLRELGEEHPDTLNSSRALAAVHMAQGREAEALEILTETLELQRRLLGEEHPDTLKSLNNLAVIHSNRGEDALAESLHRQIYQTRLRDLGEEHRDTLISMTNLASICWQQGKVSEAESLFVEAQRILKRHLGDEHPDTLRATRWLASLYLGQGRDAEADPLFAHTLEIQKRVLGEEHPDTLWSMSAIAAQYRKHDRFGEAEGLYDIVLETRRRVLGEEHPDTLWAMNNLANLFVDRGRHVEAERLFKTAMEIHLRDRGNEHPDTLVVMHNLAHLYRRQGRFLEAEPLFLQTLEVEKRLHGERHPETLQAMHSLAMLYADQHRHEEAEAQYEAVIAARSEVLGKDHPSTLWSRQGLAGVYSSSGRYDEAEEIYEQVQAARLELYGPDHPDTLEVKDQFVHLYMKQARYQEAEEVNDQVLEMRRRIFGESHPNTLHTLHHAAALHLHQGRFDEAEAISLGVIDQLETAGEAVPEILQSMRYLAGRYLAHGMYEKVTPLLEQSLASHRKMYGAEHIGTLDSALWLAAALAARQDYPGALRLLEEYLPIMRRVLLIEHQTTWAAYWALVDVYKRLDRPADALALQRDVFEELLSRADAADSTPALLNMAAVWLLTHDVQEWRDPARAEKYAQRACQLEESSGGKELWRYLDTLAGAQQALGQTADATATRTRARQALPQQPEAFAQKIQMAQQFAAQGRYVEADKLLQEVLSDQEELYGADTCRSGEFMRVFAMQYASWGWQGKAESLLRTAVSHQKTAHGTAHEHTLLTLETLAGVLSRMSKPAETAKVYEELVEARTELSGPADPRTLKMLNGLGLYLQRAGELERSAEIFEDAIPRIRDVMGDRNQDTLGTVTNLAITYNAMERYEDARVILEPNLALKRQILGVNHGSTHVAIDTLAQTYEGLGRSDEALELDREHLGLHLAQADQPDANPHQVANVAYDLLTARRPELRDPERALAYAQKACDLEEKAGGARLWIYLETLARAQYATGDAAAAIETQQRALSLVPEGADTGARKRMETLLAGMRAGEPSAQLTPPSATLH